MLRDFPLALDKSVWDIYVDTYDDTSIEQIVDIYRDIKEKLIKNHNADLTLITKILLGVFGFVPALDQNFCNSMRLASKNECGFRRMNMTSLMAIKKFYEANKSAINNYPQRHIPSISSAAKKRPYIIPKPK